MSIDIAILISIISAGFAIFFGITTFHRNNKKDTESNAEERATMNAMVMTKLDSISEDIKDMRRDFKDTQKEVQSLHDRVVVVEEAIKRIDIN
jgi:sensor histidine kinase regulating citrate/malate metabolism